MAEVNSVYSAVAEEAYLLENLTASARFHAGPPPCLFGQPLRRLAAGGLGLYTARIDIGWTPAAVRIVSLQAGAKPKADVKTLQDRGRLTEELYPHIESSV